MLQNFGLTFFDRLKKSLILSFGSAVVRLTEPEGSVVRPNLAEPPSLADTDADADSSVVHYQLLLKFLTDQFYKMAKEKQ